MSLPESLEAAASALPEQADAIRPANGDPARLLASLDGVAAARVLSWLLEHRPEDGGELAEAWAEQEDGSAALASLSQASLPKAGRKILRRVQHRLRSRGVEVVEEAPRPLVAKLPDVEDGLDAAYLSPLDPGGTRIAYFLEANPSGGARLFEVVFDDARGIVGFDLYTTPRRNARAFLKELRGRDRFPAVEAPPASARAAVARALAAQPKDRPAPRAFAEWRGHLTAVAEGTLLPGGLAQQALTGSISESELPAAVALLEQGRVGPWPPPPEQLSQIFERMRSALDSPVIVSDAAKREQLDALLADAMDEVFDQEALGLAAHRFRESAFVFWKRDEKEAASACLAAADHLEEVAPRESPVARALLEVPLGPALRSLEQAGATAENESEQESLLVKP